MDCSVARNFLLNCRDYKRMKCYLIAMAMAFSFTANLAAQTVSTDFGISDGFITGGTADVVLDGLVTFSGGQQQQSFLGAAYNSGPDAYLFINGAGGFNGAASTGDTGNILFGGGGATSVSFHAADLAYGAATAFTSFDVNDDQIETLLTQVNALNNNPGNVGEILNFSAVDGRNIFRIEANLPGPAANAPYAASIDTFSATVAAAVPEPSSLALLGLVASCGLLRRRR